MSTPSNGFRLRHPDAPDPITAAMKEHEQPEPDDKAKPASRSKKTDPPVEGEEK